MPSIPWGVREDRFKLRFASGQPRHDCADRYSESINNFPVRKVVQIKKAPRPPCTSRQLAKAHLERFPRPGISKPQDLRPENHEHREETALLDASCGGES